MSSCPTDATAARLEMFERLPPCDCDFDPIIPCACVRSAAWTLLGLDVETWAELIAGWADVLLLQPDAGDDYRARPLAYTPTSEHPGSEAKIVVMVARVAAGCAPTHPLDARGFPAGMTRVMRHYPNGTACFGPLVDEKSLPAPKDWQRKQGFRVYATFDE